MTRSLRLLWPRLCALTLILLPRIALAANEALGDADDIDVGTGGDGEIKDVIINIVKKILTFVAVLAVAMIVFAGIWLIVGSYDESSKEKAKKMIIYTIIGLLIIMLAQAIVTFVLDIN
jgi:type IV secretory pathway VirB2 component (pilin)